MISVTRNRDCLPSARTSLPRGTPTYAFSSLETQSHRVECYISTGYADITQEVAQKASCLAPKTFVSTLRTVKTALLASSSPSKAAGGDEIDPTAYATLISKHRIGQPLRVERWMKEAQAALVALPRFQRDSASRPAESGAEVRIAVFFWVCRAIKVRKTFNETSGKTISLQRFLSTFLPSSQVCSIYRWSTSTTSHSRPSIAS
jgi:hypothetical protein